MTSNEVTVKQAADAVGLSVRAVQTRIAKGQLKARKAIPGLTSPYLVPSEEVERLKAELAGEAKR